MKRLTISFGKSQYGVRMAAFDQENLEKALELMQNSGCTLREILDETCDIDEPIDFEDDSQLFYAPIYDSVTVYDENEECVYDGNPGFLTEEYVADVEDEEDEFCQIEWEETPYEKGMKYREQGKTALLWVEVDDPAIPFVLELPDNEKFDPRKLKLSLNATLNEEVVVNGVKYDGKELELEDEWCNSGCYSNAYIISDNGIETL